MLQHIIFCFYFSSFIVISFARNYFTNPFSFEIDQCKDICSDSYFLLPLSKDSQTICQRGCRFFNIIDIKAERNLNETNKECHLSCAESYTNTKSKGSCTIGCDTMSKKKQSDLQKFFPYLEQYNVDEQEFDSLEADILLDPLIRKQVQVGYDLQYKIPEAYIRTMPIDDNDLIDADDPTFKQYKSKFICTSIIPLTIFIAILLGLILCTLKIIQLIQAIKYKTAGALEGPILKVSVDEGSFDISNCKPYAVNQIPDMINFSDDSNKISVNNITAALN